MFLGEYPKGIPFLFICMKEKKESDHWDAQGLIKTLVKLKIISDSYHKTHLVFIA